ncbi:uncharacterized protein [Penaeus vannamei]|uniref:uncharacterized protein isoform X2 n=1 Tax=Penaeus vannamei TaxID=6689 RepID=UPI00387F87AF
MDKFNPCRSQGYRSVYKALLCAVALLTISALVHFQSVKTLLPEADSVTDYLKRHHQPFKKLDLSLRNYTLPRCNCTRVGFDIKGLLQEQHAAREQPEVFPPWFLKRFDFEGESTCSDFSTQRGKDQRVLAYSYYTTNGSPDYFRYLSQLHGTAKDVERLYPGWIMRIYHNTTSTDVFGRKELCRLYCENDHVDLCHIHDLPGLGNLNKRGVVGRMWRFAVMGDPTVEVFLSRDADSWVLDREAAAVHEWLRSGRSFHVMHDHPVHRALMMAGLWGAFNKNQTLMRKMRDRMFNSPRNLDKAYDQRLLLNIVWPVVKNDVLNHDSYTCLHPSHINATPFPTKREDNKYCGWGISKGTARRKLSKKSCPIACRPKEHPDWTKC